MHEVRPPRYGKSNACFNEAPTLGELVLTWEYRLSGSAFDAVAADSHHRDILYVGSRNGVFRSTDGGRTLEGWTNPAERLPTARAFDSDGRYAWLAADEGSLYPCAD